MRSEGARYIPSLTPPFECLSYSHFISFKILDFMSSQKLLFANTKKIARELKIKEKETPSLKNFYVQLMYERIFIFFKKINFIFWCAK
jgi:hypothetical protein